MKTLNRRQAVGGLAAAAAAIALPALAQNDRRIVLGQSAAFSGAAAQLGIQMNRGARLYFDAINAGGGINGAQIELRTLDDQYEPDKCRANTEAFIKDDVFALFGYASISPLQLPAMTMTMKRKPRRPQPSRPMVMTHPKKKAELQRRTASRSPRKSKPRRCAPSSPSVTWRPSV